MKQKYEILKNEDGSQLIIREMAELDKDIMSLLCEESYDASVIESAIGAGKDRLISTLRTKNLYPPRSYAEKLAEAVINFYAGPGLEPLVVLFDDTTTLSKEILVEELMDLGEEEAEVLDDLLDDDFEENPDENDEIKIDPSIKIADDDVGDVEDDL
ncbi:MAG: hypothetical protein WA151_03820 [Desulfatirhabdiaceae bacterium]